MLENGQQKKKVIILSWEKKLFVRGLGDLGHEATLSS